MEVDRFTLLVVATSVPALAMPGPLQVLWLAMVGLFLPDLLSAKTLADELEAL